MATFTISPVAIVANVEKDSAGQILGTQIQSVQVQLTDSAGNATPLAGSNWLTTVGNVKQWGVQFSTDGGATWNWGPIFQGDVSNSAVWIPFGSLGSKTGQLPALRNNNWAGLVGNVLRLAIVTDANITLGAVVTVN